MVRSPRPPHALPYGRRGALCSALCALRVRACVRACVIWGDGGMCARLKRRPCAVGWVSNSGAGWGKGPDELLGEWWR